MDLLTYINVTLLGLKPFHFNLFKTSLILLCLAASIWILVSRSGLQRVLQRQACFEHWSNNKHQVLSWCLGGLFALFLIDLRVMQYLELQTMWDMAVETNIAWHMVHDPWFFNSFDNRSHLGQHFSPVWLLVGLVYRLVEHPMTLLVLQSLALGLGAVAVYRLGLLRCKSKALTLLLVALYMANPYLHHSNAHDFHRSPLAIPVILWLLVFVESNRAAPAIVCAVLALAIEESIPLPLAGLGIYLAVFREGWRKFGIGLIVGSIGYFFLVTKVLLPMFSPEQGLYFWERYANLGENFNEALLNLTLNPFWAVTEALTRHRQFIYLFYFLIPVGMMPLFAWREAFMLVIPLAMMFLSQNDGQFKLGFHYSAPALPFLFYSTMCGLCRAVDVVRRWASTSFVRWKVVCAGFLILMAVNCYRCPGYDIGKTDAYFSSSAFEITGLIPAAASVATDVRYAPLLANRHRICKVSLTVGTVCDWVPVGATVRRSGIGQHEQADPQWVPEYILIGAELRTAPTHEVERQRIYSEWLKTGQGYEELIVQDGISLLHMNLISQDRGK